MRVPANINYANPEFDQVACDPVTNPDAFADVTLGNINYITTLTTPCVEIGSWESSSGEEEYVTERTFFATDCLLFGVFRVSNSPTPSITPSVTPHGDTLP